MQHCLFVSLDTTLCPTVPQELTASDWDYNVHADNQVFFFRSLDYLLNRVAAEGFAFAGFDLVDVRGGVSALTNCGEGVFVNVELSELGLLTDLGGRRRCRPRCGCSIQRSPARSVMSGPFGGDGSMGSERPHDGRADFDFLLGSWTCTSRHASKGRPNGRSSPAPVGSAPS